MGGQIPFIHAFIHPSNKSSTLPSLLPSVYPFFDLSVCLSIPLSICQSLSQSVSRALWLSEHNSQIIRSPIFRASGDNEGADGDGSGRQDPSHRPPRKPPPPPSIPPAEGRAFSRSSIEALMRTACEMRTLDGAYSGSNERRLLTLSRPRLRRSTDGGGGDRRMGPIERPRATRKFITALYFRMQFSTSANQDRQWCRMGERGVERE